MSGNTLVSNMLSSDLRQLRLNGHRDEQYQSGSPSSPRQLPPHLKVAKNGSTTSNGSIDSSRSASSKPSSSKATSVKKASSASARKGASSDPSTYASTDRGARRVLQLQVKDVESWQFWPHAMGMGSLTGRNFTQMFGGNCKKGIDPDNHMGYGHSFLAFNFKQETLVIKTRFAVSQQAELPPAFRPLDAELPFSDISRQGIQAVEERRADDRITLTVTVTCRRPPRFFCAIENVSPQVGDRDKSRGAGRLYRRRATAMDFTVSSTQEIAAGVLRTVPDGAVANPTFWNTYRWTFVFNREEMVLFRKCANKLRLFSMDNPDNELLYEDHRRLIFHPRPQTDWEFPNLERWDFGTRALIEGLVGNGIVIPGDVAGLMTALRYSAPGELFRHHLLETLFTEERIRDPSHMVEARARFLRRQQTIRSVDHLVLIRTVQVTPTRVLVGPPQQETSNSVTRRYANKLDAIIRVQFVDEGDRLHIVDYTKKSDELNPNVGLMARIRRALQHGIMVAGQRFHPVASSSSQQKEHSMWFVNNSVIDRLELARWMGMPKENVVAKYAARMGLPFSASRSVDVKFEVSRWKDTQRLGACFTDGCSVAGMEVMKQAANVLGAKGINAQPSAVQFRLGGAKGVLAYWPDLVGDNEIKLRPSQEKFSSPLEELNVIRVAHYQVGFLNRQFIVIMSALGVPDSLFLELFENEVQGVRGLAKRVEHGVPSKMDTLYMDIYTSFPLNVLVNSGFNKDPFIVDLCRLIECRALQDLKWRARIRIPQSVYLIGISDETGTLKEGELFCQYQKDEKSEPVVVTGKVLVCRAPALHPGDVRHAVAVDNPHLRHLKNVIVFNTAGLRPLPDMLGGGDLDGDDYTLIWDQRFVRPLKEHTAMDYTAPKPVTVDMVTQKHLNENFVQYILNDVLGQVDNAHLANCDITSPFNAVCLELSEVHSAAVDFAKTGIAVDTDPSWFPQKWPDFMGKSDDRTYMSHKILGVLFRSVNATPMFAPVNIADIDYPFDNRFSSAPICPQLIHALISIKTRFEQGMTYTMRRYRVRESEVVAGMAIQTKQRKRSREITHLQEPLKDTWEALVSETRSIALEIAAAVAQQYRLNFRTPQHIIALHAYFMTYNKEHVEDYEACLLLDGSDHGFFGADAGSLHPSPMLSFAWLWAGELIEYAQHLKREAHREKLL